MKVLGLILGTLCLAGQAAASDLPKAPADVVALATSWSGFYFGATAGWYQSRRQTVTFSTSDAPGTLGPSAGPAAPTSFASTGTVGGIHLGYNWQFAPRFLLGFEADRDFASTRGHGASFNVSTVGAIPFASDTDQVLPWFGTVRARLGFLPTEHLLIYGTGGFAYGRIDQDATYTNMSEFNSLSSSNGICNNLSVCYRGSKSRNADGWAAGGGMEYALPNHWTIRAEYLYVKLGGADSFD